MKLFAGLEANRFSRNDADFGACAGIAADARLPWLDGEHTKAAKLDSIAAQHALFHAIEDGVDRGFGFRSRKAGALDDPLY